MDIIESSAEPGSAIHEAAFDTLTLLYGHALSATQPRSSEGAVGGALQSKWVNEHNASEEHEDAIFDRKALERLEKRGYNFTKKDTGNKY